jgi:glycine cleavage system H protein
MLEGGKTVKEISELQFPDDFLYATDHEWAKPEGDKSGWASATMPGSARRHRLCRVAANRRHARQGRAVRHRRIRQSRIRTEHARGRRNLSVNKALEESPEFVNKEPYGSGWMIEIKPGDQTELEGLMTKDVYLGLLKGLNK